MVLIFVAIYFENLKIIKYDNITFCLLNKCLPKYLNILIPTITLKPFYSMRKCLRLGIDCGTKEVHLACVVHGSVARHRINMRVYNNPV